MPSPLDRNLLAYYAMEDYLENTFTEDVNNIDLQVGIQFDESNEPDVICKCEQDEAVFTEEVSQNYAYIHDHSFIDQLPINVGQTLNINKLELQFSIFFEDVLQVRQTTLFQHGQIWNLTIYNKTIMNFAFNKKSYNLTLIQDYMNQDSVIFNSWITYSLKASQNVLTFTINDFTNPELTQTITLDEAFYITIDPLQQSSFIINNYDLVLILRSIDYSINGIQQLSQIFSRDNFIQTTDDIFSNGDKDKQKQIVQGYFINRKNITSQGNLSSSNLQFKQIRGPCNQSDPNFGFDGLVCKDRKKQFGLNLQTQNNGNSAVQGFVQSSNGYFTFETWINFQGFLNQEQTNAVIMANYQQLANPMIVIQLVKSGELLSLECNPYFQQKKIPGYLDSAYLRDSIKPNQWMHIACVSNPQVDDQWLKVFALDHKSQTLNSNYTENSHTINLPSGQYLRTLIGNLLDYSAPFKGMIKEIRIWSETRTESQLSMYRYQAIPNQSRSKLLAYTMLNQGFGDRIAELSHSISYVTDFFTYSKISPIQQIQSSDKILICSANTYFDYEKGCCVSDEFNIDILKTMSEGEDGENQIILTAQINYSYSSYDSESDEVFTPLWSLKNLQQLQSNNDSSQNLAQLTQQLQKANIKKSFELIINEDYLSTSIRYIFQVSVTSILRIYNQTIAKEFWITPQCPSIEIKPTYNSLHKMSVSKFMNPQDLVLTLDLLTTCQDQFDNFDVSIHSTSKSENLYNYDSQTQKINFVKFPQDQNQEYIYLTAYLNYTKDVEPRNILDYIMIQLIEQPIQLVIKEVPKRIKLPQDYLIIDLSTSKVLVDYYEANDLVYGLECPIQLFKTYEEQRRLCVVNQKNGIASLSLTDLDIVLNANYEFKYSISSKYLNFTIKNSFKTSFYRTQYLNCPQITIPSFTYFTKNVDIMLIQPNINLDCMESLNVEGSQQITNHKIQRIDWNIEGYENANQFLNISEDGLVAFLREDLRDQIQHGFNTNIKFNVKVDDQWYNVSTYMLLKKSMVQVEYVTSIKNGAIQFNETLLIDAQQSYDPDYRNAQLTYNWMLSSKNLDIKYVNGLKISMTVFDRLQKQMLVGLSNQIVLDVQNPEYQESRVQKPFDFTFNKYDVKKTNYSSCQIVLKQDTLNLNFSYINLTNLEFEAQLNADLCNLNSAQSDFYIFTQDSMQPYFKNNKINVTKDTMQILKLGQTYPIDFVYLFSSYKDNKLVFDYLVKSIFINRVASPLIVNFTNGFDYQVGQEESLIIDASTSFDPDTSIQKQFRYFWICPTSLNCGQSSPQFILTKQLRQQANLNSINQTFQLGLQIQNPSGKQSMQTYVNIKIIQQDYESCLKVNVSSIDGIVKVKRDQIFPYQIRLYFNFICENVNIKQIDWITTQDGIPKFWSNDDDGQSIMLKNSLVLPKSTNKVDFQVTVKYGGADWAISEFTKTMRFQLQILESDLVPIIKVPNYIVNLNTQDIIIDASYTYDPDNDTALLTCQYDCPLSIITTEKCLQQTQGCKIKISASEILANNQIDYQTYTFGIQIQTETGKMLNKSVLITLVNNQLAQSLPLCSISTNKLNQILVEDNTILYPSCNFKTEEAKKLSAIANYSYEWRLMTDNKQYLLKDYALTIPPFKLHQFLNKTNFTKLNVSLIVKDIENPLLVYETQQTFDIPQFLPSYSNQAFTGYIKTIPSSGYTLFSTFLVDIKNYTLLDNEYFRIRVNLTDGSQEILVNKAYSYSYLINFPSAVNIIYIDVISGQLQHGNSYTVFVMEQSILVEDFKMLSIQAFNQLVIPQLSQDIQITDYTDLAQLQTQLNTYYGLMIAISRMNSQELQQSYMQSLLNKCLQVYNNTNYQSFDDTEQIILRNLFMKIFSLAYSKIASQDFLYFKEISALLSKDLLTESVILKLRDPTTNYRQLNDYTNSLYKLLKNSMIQISQKEKFNQFFYQLISSQLVQGQSKVFNSLENDNIITQIQRLKDIDFLGLKILSVNSPILNDLSRVYFNTTQFPENVFQVQLKYFKNQDNTDYSDLMKSYTASRTQVQITLMDRDFNKAYTFNQGAQIQFNIQQSLRKEIQYMENLEERFQCISKSDEAEDFDYEDKRIIADISMLKEGYVTCKSPHLSIFDLIYSPRVEYFTIDYKPFQGSRITMFQKMPILRFILPGAFILFVVVMIMIGKLVESADKNRPQKYYNKLSMNENIQKHKFLRLFGAMLLQFNPFFNYVIKTNYYLERQIRLLILTSYFLFVSSISLLIFTGHDNSINDGLIFAIALFTIFAITIIRPRLQNLLFSLFYPKSLKRWRYQSGQNQLENERMIQQEELESGRIPNQKLLFDDFNQSYNNINDSMRLENSMNRMLGQFHDFSQIILNKQGPSNDDTVQGDEILNYRKTKSLKRQPNSTQQSHESSLYKKTMRKKKNIQQNIGKLSNDIEMQDFTPTPKDDQQVQNSPKFEKVNEQMYIENKHEKNDPFQEIVVLDSIPRELNILEGKNQQSQNTQNQQDEDLEIIINEEFKNSQDFEGGEDEEEVKEFDAIEKQIFPQYNENQLEQKPRKKPKKIKSQIQNDIQANQEKPRKKKRRQQIMQNEEEFNQNLEESSQQDESTPSLEGIFENYRTLDKQYVPLIRRIFGTSLLLIICFTLVFLHAFFMPKLEEQQFQNWFSCTLLTFLMQIFVVDTLLYALIAYQLKTYGVTNISQRCNKHYLMVQLPLGKYKYEELEIELAKLKDFDAEYNLLRYL
eukprot:403357971